jgi:acyl-CoA thioester hydrolase
LGEPFRHRLRVRWHECDQQGVVFNAHYLAFFDMAITELFREAVGGYLSMVEDGTDLVVAEARIRYLAPLRFDDEFDLVILVADLGTTSMRTELAVEHDGETLAEGELRHVFVDAENGGKAPMPAQVRAALEAYQGG